MTGKGEVIVVDIPDGANYQAQFAEGNSRTTAPTTGWVDAPLSPRDGWYLWQRTRVVTPQPDGTLSYTEWSTFLVGSNGDAAVIFKLLPSCTVIKRSMAGVCSPATVSCQQLKIVGNNAAVPSAEKTLKFQTSAMSSPAIYSAPISVGVLDWVEFTLWNGSTLLDVQRVQVVSDSEGLEIGGRNLIPQSLYRMVNYVNGEWVAQFNKQFSLSLTYNMLRLSDSGTYTFSVYVYNETTTTAAVRVVKNGKSLIYLKFFEQGWSRLVYTFDAIADDYLYFELYNHVFQADGVFSPLVKAKKIKLEKGNIATDWTPTPEDQEAVNTVFEGKFEATDKAIAGKVSATDYNIDKVVIGQRFTAVEATTNGLVTTVSSNKTDADGKITNLQSQVEQNAGKWELEIIDRQSGDSELSSRIAANAGAIALKVSSSTYNDDKKDINAAIANVKTSADNATSAINAMNADDVFDISEKQTIRIEWDKINGIYGTYGKAIAEASKCGVNFFNLSIARDNLNGYLTTTLKLSVNENTVELGFRNALANKFGDYYAAEQAIWSDIAEAKSDKPNLALKTNQGVTGWGFITETGAENFTICKSSRGDGVEVDIDNWALLGSYQFLHFDLLNKAQIVPGKTYTVSFDLWCDMPTMFNVAFSTYTGAVNGNTEILTYGGDITQRMTALITPTKALTNEVLYLASFRNEKPLEIHIDNLTITEGTAVRAYKPATDDRLEKGMLDTGMDIFHKKMIVTTDTWEMQNNSGERTAVLDKNGQFTVGMINTELLKTTKVECYGMFDGVKMMLSSLNARGDGMLAYYYDNGQISKEDKPVFEQIMVGNRLQTRIVGVKTIWYNRDGTVNYVIGIDGQPDTPPPPVQITYAWTYKPFICFACDPEAFFLSGENYKRMQDIGSILAVQFMPGYKTASRVSMSICSSNSTGYNDTIVRENLTGFTKEYVGDRSIFFTGIIFVDDTAICVDVAEKRYQRRYMRYVNGSNQMGVQVINWQE